MPLIRRMPKRGFNNAEFKKRWGIVNLSALEDFDAGTTIDESLLRANGLISGRLDGVKILGQGNLAHSLNISAHVFSKSAQEKIAKAGGRAEVIK